MSKSKVYFLILLFGFFSCGNNKCENKEIHEWIKDAPIALEEFNEVKKEVLDNKEFVTKFTHDGQLFLTRNQVNEYKKYSSLPSLLRWFDKGRGYINISNDQISFSFKECISGGSTANGTMYYNSKNKLNYKASVIVIDSLNFGNGWTAVVTSCKDCNN